MITNSSILDVAAVLYPPLGPHKKDGQESSLQSFPISYFFKEAYRVVKILHIYKQFIDLKSFTFFIIIYIILKFTFKAVFYENNA